MKRLRTIYRHIGYFNSYETIQSFCTRVGENAVVLNPYLVEKAVGIRDYIEDLDPDDPDKRLVVEEENRHLYYSSDRNLIFTTTSIDLTFNVNVDADDYDPNKVSCDVYVDVYEFVGVEMPFSLEEFKQNIGIFDNEIIMGMSYDSNKCASMWHTFRREKYESYDKWVEAFFREFVFQYSRDDIKYLDVISRRDNKVFNL